MANLAMHINAWAISGFIGQFLFWPRFCIINYFGKAWRKYHHRGYYPVSEHGRKRHIANICNPHVHIT
ncbi:hypothetical protein B188_25790 [Candidatus Brocadiaceae bacterium B188]|nr:hypothetical protein B188_25790 [Candidatus Brocadiaceae bacterium B188]